MISRWVIYLLDKKLLNVGFPSMLSNCFHFIFDCREIAAKIIKDTRMLKFPLAYRIFLHLRG